MTEIERIESSISEAMKNEFSSVSGLLICDGAYPDNDIELNKVFKQGQTQLNGSIYICWMGEKVNEKSEKIGKSYFTDYGIAILCLSKKRKGDNSASEYYERVMKAMSVLEVNFVSGDISTAPVNENFFVSQLLYTKKIRRSF